jgi:hypothetical protein
MNLQEYQNRVAHLRLHAAATFETRKTIFRSKGTPMGIRSAISAFVVLAFVVGCGAESHSSSSLSDEMFVMAEPPAVQPNAQASESAVADNAGVVQQQPVRVNGQNVDRPVAAVVGEPAALQKRKIIFNATIALRVDDLDKAFDQLFSLVEQNGGYISSSLAHGNAGSARSSQWTMRIPGGKFSGFTKSVAGLGEVVTNAMTSQEVTAEFHDLVRGEVESMQGRMRVLADLTSLSTVTVRMSEVVEFVPPILAGEPTFGDQIASTWASTVDSMSEFGQSVILLAIRVLPWLVVLGVPCVLIVWSIKRRFRISRAAVSQ